MTPTSPADPHRCLLVGTSIRFCSEGCRLQAEGLSIFDDIRGETLAHEILSRGRWDS